MFYKMKVCCVFSLESPHWGDSNEYTQYTVFIIKKTIALNYHKSAAKGFFSWGLKNEFETAMVNEPSVFEPLKFYCISSIYLTFIIFWPTLGLNLKKPIKTTADDIHKYFFIVFQTK